MVKVDEDFKTLYDIFMDFHDAFEDVIADCGGEIFSLLYDMHHETFDYLNLKIRFLEMYDRFGSTLKECSTEAFEELEKIVKKLRIES